MKKSTMILAGLVILTVVILIVMMTNHKVYKVSPNESIQEVLNITEPGDIIELEAGIYNQSFETRRDGKKNNPIVIRGPKEAILKGDERYRTVRIFHDHIHIEGFTIDGLRGDGDSRSSYTNKLVYVLGQEEKQGIRGFKLINMTLKNSGGEAVRLRYYCRGAEIAYSRFINIGVYDFKFNGSGKNGEGIYVGTSSTQWDQDKNPTSGPDKSSNNWIHHNYFNTKGNECIDIKEGADNNLIEYNNCTGQKDPESGGISVRGSNNTIRYNYIYDNLGAGIRIGGNTVNNVTYGRNNIIHNNRIINNNLGIKVLVEPQEIYNNTCEGNKEAKC